MDELAEHGFGGLTVDAVAARAGVGKATIYRRWPAKADLVLDAVATVIPHPDLPDTGSLRDDLIALFNQTFAKQQFNRYHQVMAGIMAEAMVNDEVKELLRQFVANRKTVSRAVIDRAQHRGELAHDVDPELVSDLIGGALMHRSLLRGREISPKRVAQVVDATLHGILA